MLRLLVIILAAVAGTAYFKMHHPSASLSEVASQFDSKSDTATTPEGAGNQTTTRGVDLNRRDDSGSDGGSMRQSHHSSNAAGMGGGNYRMVMGSSGLGGRMGSNDFVSGMGNLFGGMTHHHSRDTEPYSGIPTQPNDMSNSATSGHMNEGNAPVALSARELAELRERNSNALLLMDAAEHGDQTKVDELLGKNIAIDGRDGDRRTPLMYAAWAGQNAICSKLLAAGAGMRFLDKSGNSALDYAASRGLVDTVSFLLARSHSEDAKHALEYAGIIQAVYAGDASKLPAGMLDTINRIAPGGISPLHVAAGNGAVQLIAALVERGGDVNVKNEEQQTPLHWAAWNNKPDAIDYLIEKGATVSASDLGGNTPLMLAAQNGNQEAVSALLKHGAKPDTANAAGKTALMLAEAGGHKDVAALLQ